MVGQPHVDGLLAGPEQAAEGFRCGLEAVAPALFHHVNELLVDLVQHGLGKFTLFFGLGAERVHKTLVFTCGEQTALHTQFVHQAREAKTVHQHTNAADDAGLVDVDFVGRCGDVVRGRGACFFHHGVHRFLVFFFQAQDFVVDDASLHRAAAG